MAERWGVGWEQGVEVFRNSQIKEAEIMALNKIDALTEEQAEFC